MELTAWLSLASICILGAMTPGQSFIVVLKHSVAGGRINGLVASVAHGLGVVIYATLTVIGLAIIIKQTPWLFNLIKYTGVAFLIWMAYKSLTSNSAVSKLVEQDITVTIKESFWEGLMIAFLNPKLAIFFLALFSQFVDAQASWQQNVIMVSTVGGIDTVWYCLVALVLSQSVVLKKLRNNVHVVEKLTGIALLAVAARVVL